MRAWVRSLLDEADTKTALKAKDGDQPKRVDPRFITPAGVTALCTAAEEALYKAKRINERKRVVKFVWYGRAYKVRRDACRLLVDTLTGKSVACRWD